VSCGRFRTCYFVERPPANKVGAKCASLIYPDVSTDRDPAARPGPGILYILWPVAKADEQSTLPPGGRERVCSACKTLVEKRSRAAQPDRAHGAVPGMSTLTVTTAGSVDGLPHTVTSVGGPADPLSYTEGGRLAAARATPGPDTAVPNVTDAVPLATLCVAQPCVPAAGGFGCAPATAVRSTTVVFGSSGSCMDAVAGADAESGNFAISTVVAAHGTLDGSPDAGGSSVPIDDDAAGASSTTGDATGTPTGSAGDQSASVPRPSVDLAIATVVDAYGTLDSSQRRAIGNMVSVHLAAEKPKEWRARSGNWRDLLYIRETVPRKVVVGPRHARRRSVEASSAVAGLCGQDEAAFWKMLTGVCRRAS